MSGWYSNITSRVSNLQRSYFGGEADGDTEDDTHVCRVLRNYYTEKGKPFPGWLPPDPKAPPPVAAVYSQPQQVGSRYGGMTQQPQGGSLSSLWDNNNPVSQPQDAQSLRRGRGVPPPMRNSDAMNSQFRNSDPMAGQDMLQPRPLPSQRAGSYQNGPTPPASSGTSAQDRLKQRLFGGNRTTSPGNSGPYQPPPPTGSRGGSSGDYEERFAPGGAYDAGRRGGGNDRPVMSANSPWSSNEPDYSGAGSGGRTGGGRRPGGLPSGPRMR
ncbi:Sec1-binding region of Mso1-domain-containing protein [Xylariaceae sp. FL1019]|nr:Sec1-binding region of Mso1-domain-containing protein [Xylariaceae sp. FL1019]